MIEEYRNYKKNIKELYEDIGTNVKVLVERFASIIKVLNIIEEENENEISDEMMALFDYGFDFLKYQFGIIRTIYQDYCFSNFEKLHLYTPAILIYLDCEDLKKFLENEIGPNNQRKYNRLCEIAESIISSLQNGKLLDKYNLSLINKEISSFKLDDKLTIYFFDKLFAEAFENMTDA